MDKVLKIGIIGCGAIGKDHCRRIIETVPGATVVAVSDYVAAAADDTAAKYGIRSFGNDCDGMIKDPEVEAVVITSIDPTHHDYVMKTLAEEKWCFCEKPLSQNAKDCEEIINREQEIGKRLVQVGFMRHYDRGYAEMKRIIESGELGAPLVIKACHLAGHREHTAELQDGLCKHQPRGPACIVHRCQRQHRLARPKRGPERRTGRNGHLEHSAT